MRAFVLTMTVVAGLLAAGNTATGTWNIQTDIMGNVGTSACTFKQDADKFTGACSVLGVDQAVAGEVKDETVTFRHGGEYEGQALTMVYTGKFESATVFAGEVVVEPFGVAGVFRATKKE